MPKPRPAAALHGALPIVIAALALAGVALAIATNWAGFAHIGGFVLRASWVLPALVALHLAQLFLAGIAWRSLCAAGAPGLKIFYRLRIVREGIDSLLPVAQVGGEIIGVRLLAANGVTPSEAAASVVVDVTMELLTQVIFLLSGLCALSLLSQAAFWRTWIGASLAAAALAASFLLAQRFGVLRALETLMDGITRRWPALAGASLAGLHAAALDIYRHPARISRNIALHLVAWAAGSVETWIVLHALGIAASPLQAFAIESLGMAARSAGFAIPAALGAQEGGFVLAAAAVSLPMGPALALSLVKRLREILVGLIGLALWRGSARRPVPGARMSA